MRLLLLIVLAIFAIRTQAKYERQRTHAARDATFDRIRTSKTGAVGLILLPPESLNISAE